MRESNAYTVVKKENEPEALVKFVDDFVTASGKNISIANRARTNALLSLKLLKLLSSHNLPNFYKGVTSKTEMRVKALETIPVIFSIINNVEEGTTAIDYLLVDENGNETPVTDAEILAQEIVQAPQLYELRRQSLKTNAILKDYFNRRKVSLQKMRLEFSRQDSKLMLSTIFTMDSCDFVDLELNEKLSYTAIVKKADKAEELFEAFMAKLNL